MTKMATASIFGKNFENLLLKNRTTDDLETLHVAFVVKVY